MKTFLKQLTASFLGSCFSLTFLAIFIFAGIASVIGVFVSSLSDTIKLENHATEIVPQNAVLVIDLSRGFSDAGTFSPANLAGLFSSNNGRYGLLDTVRALETAQTDDAIRGVLFIGGSAGGDNGFATINELRNAILRFRKSGEKQVFTYLPSPSTKDYLLATASDKIWIHPYSELPLNGYASSNLYLKNAFEKIGIGVQITRVGTHKAAVEPLISNSMSPEDRIQRERIVNEEWAQTLQIIGNARSATTSKSYPALLAKNINGIGIFSAKSAVENNLVDAILYEDELIEQLKTIAETNEKTNSFQQIALDDYIRSRGIATEPPLSPINPKNERPENNSPAIAIVYAEGEIVDGLGSVNNVGGKWFSRALRELRNDDSVKAVVLRINSPGGSVFASEQIRREADLLSQKKPLVVSMGDLAASGGYWISTPAKKVFADPMTVTGSIGVFGLLFNLEELGKKIGVNTESVLSAPLAELDTIRRPKTPEEMAVFQKMTDQIYADFLGLVAKARGLTIEEVDAIAQGQVWIGKHAMEKKLVDEFGGLVDAIAFARQEAELDDNARIISIPGEVNRFQELLNMLGGRSDPVSFANAKIDTGNNPALNMLCKNLRAFADQLRAFNDPNGIYARLPFNATAE